jgi:hypothetical protein
VFDLSIDICVQVRPYYNPSLGWWLKDLTRVSYMYIRAPTADPVVTGLAKHLSAVSRATLLENLLPSTFGRRSHTDTMQMDGTST